MYVVPVMIVQMSFAVLSGYGIESSQRVRINYLHVDCIEVSDEEYRLDVDYRIEVDPWNANDRYEFQMRLIARNDRDKTPAKGSDGKPLAWCVGLYVPTKQRSDKAEWRATFHVRLNRKKQFPGNPRDYRLYATVMQAEDNTLADRGPVPLHLRKFYKAGRPKPLVDLDDNHRGLLVILPGILGEDGDQRQIARMIRSETPYTDVPDTGLKVQIWDWTKLAEIRSIGLRDKARVSSETIAAAQVFANEVQEWRGRTMNRNKALYLLCGSGGASIALLAANHLLSEERIFERVVFASAAVSTKRDLTPLLRKRSGSLYNYYSHQDYILVGIIASFFGTFKYELAWPAAGRFGYRDEDNAPPNLMQLGWLKKDKLDNRGEHLKCYKRKYFREFFLPLFYDDNDPNSPQISSRWKHEVELKYQQIESIPKKCEKHAQP